MPAILQQLRARTENFPLALADSKQLKWTFGNQIKRKDDLFFSSIIINNPLLFIQYRIQCAHVIDMLNQGMSTDNYLLIQAAEAALMLAELLDQIYFRWDEKSNRDALLKDRHMLRELLSWRYPEFNLAVIQPSSLHISQKIRVFTKHTNPTRLTFYRIRRILYSAAILFDELVELRAWIEPLELLIDPVLLHLNWMFFIPRLAVNTALLVKHVVPNPWMPQKESTGLTWSTRFYTYINLNHRWVELVNDYVWCIGNLMSCFFCYGTWLPFEAFIAVGLQLFDLLFVAFKFSVEIGRLNTLKKEYHLGCGLKTITIDEGYLDALQHCIDYEIKARNLALVHHVLLLVSIMTILPVMITLNPMAPIFGVFLAISSTICTSIAETMIKKQRPEDELSSLITHGFFKTPVEVVVESPTTHLHHQH